MREYAVLAVVAILGAIAFELLVVRSGIFRRPAYWVTLVFVVVGQSIIDGFLTRASGPTFLYNPREITGWRFPADVPVEDFAMGFSLVTVSIALWQRAR